MKKSDFGVVILAAGKGTRLKSKRPKVLHEIGGQALLLHVIAAAKTIVPAEKIYCVIGHEAERVKAAVEHTGVGFVLQANPVGTGHALQIVKAWFAVNNSDVPDNLMVLSGDVPLIRAETLKELMEVHVREKAAMTILTAIPENAFGYGRVLRQEEGSVEVKAIVEQKDLAPEQLRVKEINSGIYCFETKALFTKLDLLSNENENKELY